MIVATACFFAVSFHSEAILVRCDGCNETAMANKAVRFGPGIHTLYSLPDGEARRYLVEEEAGFNYGATEMRGVPQAERDIIDNFVQFHGLTGGTMNALVEVDASDWWPTLSGRTAFDVAWNHNLRMQIASHIAMEGIPITQAVVSTVVSYVMSAMQVSGEITITVKLEFDDGSYAIYEFKPGAGQADYIELSSRTADGEFIPESPANASGIWTGASSLLYMRHHLARLGAIFSSSNDASESIVCSFDGTTLHCVID